MQKVTSTTTTRYLWGGSTNYAELSANDVVQHYYIYGAGIDEPLMVKDADGTKNYVHRDGKNTVFAITDNTGTVTNKFKMDAWGEGTDETDSPFKYTGRRIDAETGNYYYRNRYYHAKQGRFMSRDPIGYADGLNVYAYVGNDPVNNYDPMGLDGKPNENPTEDTSTPVDETFYITGPKINWGRFNLSVGLNNAMTRLSNFFSSGSWIKVMLKAEDKVKKTADYVEEILVTASRLPTLRLISWAGLPFMMQGMQAQSDCQANVGGNGPEPISATAGAGSATEYTYADGSVEVRTGGSRSWRNNNPGNMRPGPGWDGSIGKSGGFDVFSDSFFGMRALDLQLRTYANRGLSLGQAMNTYAPSSQNNTSAYLNHITGVTGLSQTTLLNSLTDGQLFQMADTIKKHEGWKTGTQVCR